MVQKGMWSAISIVLYLSSTFAQQTSNEKGAAELLKKLYDRMDSRIRPGIYGPPAVVDIDFYVQGFGSLDDVDMQLHADIDFRQTWVDPRLEFQSDEDNPVYIPYHDVSKFWVPDVYFPNSKKGEEQKLSVPNRSIRIYKNGTVKFFTRMGVTFQCTMYLAKFPLDRQKCDIKISTYSYDAAEIMLKWFDNDSIEIKEEELNLPQMNLVDWAQTDNCVEEYKTGNFSCIMATFIFQRKVGFFILQTYITSILIVMISWVAFWINKNSEPARITLGVTTVLTMTTQLTTSRSNAMRVSYPKAMDVWYSACMIFVFGALLEYALVNISVRSEKRKTAATEKEPSDVEKQKLTPEVQPEDQGGCCTQRLQRWKKSLTSKDIDQWSRRVFPLAFLVFNIFYWFAYTVFF